jgi:hypothetical protein
VSDEAVVFFFRPGPFVGMSLLAAGRSPHIHRRMKNEGARVRLWTEGR